MTQHKHLKQRVRARMEKTGESYATARRHVLARRPAAPSRSRAALALVEPPTDKAAGMRSEALRKRTGRGWNEWFALLDRAGAAALDHKGVVAELVAAGVGSWWCQMIAVGYEQARGKRAVHQRCDGTFQAGISKTFAVSLPALWQAWSVDGRGAWLEAGVVARTRKATPPRQVAKLTTPAASLRLDGGDGALVLVYFYRKTERRSTVTVQVEKLPDASAVATAKTAWRARLERLSRALAA